MPRVDTPPSPAYRRFMRKPLLAVGTLGTLGSAYVATAHCCERLNLLAAVGLARRGCLGLSHHRGLFMALCLALLVATVSLALFGPGAPERPGVLKTGALAMLATVSGLLLFVIP